MRRGDAGCSVCGSGGGGGGSFCGCGVSRTWACFRLGWRSLRVLVWELVGMGSEETGSLVGGCCFCSASHAWALRLDRRVFFSMRLM